MNEKLTYYSVALLLKQKRKKFHLSNYTGKKIRNFNRAPDIGNYEKVINTNEINKASILNVLEVHFVSIWLNFIIIFNREIKRWSWQTSLTLSLYFHMI